MPSGVYQRPAPEVRFWRKVDRNGPVMRPELGPCWQWLDKPHKSGYGRFSIRGGVYAHRFSYNLLVGAIPDDLQIDHVCRNTMCVRPEHLEPVTQRVNLLRGENPTAHNNRKTHCKRGHPLSGANLYVWMRPGGRPGRHCKECRSRDAQRYRDQRAQTNRAA